MPSCEKERYITPWLTSGSVPRGFASRQCRLYELGLVGDEVSVISTTISIFLRLNKEMQVPLSLQSSREWPLGEGVLYLL